MSRPTQLVIEPSALLHNLEQIKRCAPGKKIIAMIKANAYGCGVQQVAPVIRWTSRCFWCCLSGRSHRYSCHGGQYPGVFLFQGVFSPDEYKLVAQHQFGCVIHQEQAITLAFNTPLPVPIKIWVKVNTGMHRLGFKIKKCKG